MFKRSKRQSFPIFLPHRPDEDSYLAPPVRTEGSVESARNVPPREDWIAPEKYGKTIDEYLANGRRDTQMMLDLVGACGLSVDKLGNVLELGCADGRMLRWLEPLAADREIWGSDIDAGRILWCKQHLSPPFRFVTNTIVPHLPFEDRKFGFVFAGSVFSHIDDLADAWLAELRRLLRPGGVLFITVHLKPDVPLLATRYPQSGLAKTLRRHPDYERLLAGQFDVFTVGRSASSFVFYDLDYLRKSIEPMFRIRSVTSEVRLYQNALVLERV
jgi:SAM-dependent methyltransferase